MKQLHFNRKRLLRAIYLACMAAFMIGSARAQITAPDSVTFNGSSGFLTTGTASGSYFTTPPTWTTPAGGGLVATYTSAINYGQGASTTASVQVTNLGGSPTMASGFKESTDFIFTPSGSAYGTMSATLGALSDRNTFSSYGGTNYVASLKVYGNSGVGSLNLTCDLGGPPIDISVGTAALSVFTPGDLYNMSLQGTYDALGNLTLSFTVTDTNSPLNTATMAKTINADGSSTGIQYQFIGSGYTPVEVAVPVLTSNSFGVATSDSNIAAGVFQINDYSIDLAAAVPEPSNYALMILGGALLLGLGIKRKTTLG